MPIYEYRCGGCDTEFEQIVLKNTVPRCPTCQSEDLQRVLSSFGVSSESTRQMNLHSERRKSAKVQRDKQHAEHEYMHNHQH